MSAVSWSYEQRRALEVLNATAKALALEVEYSHTLGQLEVDSFVADLSGRLVALIFGAFPKIETKFRTSFELSSPKGPGEAGELPF